MNKLIINTQVLHQNYAQVLSWVSNNGGDLTVVTKALCGHEDTLSSLAKMGVKSVADSRLENLRKISKLRSSFERG